LKTFETRATVTADGKLTVDVPPEIEPGEHRVVVGIDELPANVDDQSPLEFGSYRIRLGLRASPFVAKTFMATTEGKPVFIDTNILV